MAWVINYMYSHSRPGGRLMEVWLPICTKWPLRPPLNIHLHSYEAVWVKCLALNHQPNNHQITNNLLHLLSYSHPQWQRAWITCHAWQFCETRWQTLNSSISTLAVLSHTRRGWKKYLDLFNYVNSPTTKLKVLHFSPCKYSFVFFVFFL